jgi:hypothetical protein
MTSTGPFGSIDTCAGALLRHAESAIIAAIRIANRISGSTRSTPLLQGFESFIDTKVDDYTRTGTLAVRSSLPQLTQAPFTARKIAFQMQ